MCSCDYHPDEDEQDSAEDLARYADMSAAYERFGDDAKLYWTTHRCANCSEPLTHPKYAVVNAERTGVLCLECRTLLAQTEFFTTFVLAGLAA